MKPNLSSSASWVAMLAVMFHLAFPSGEGTPAAVAARPSATVAKPPVASQTEGPWLASRYFFASRRPPELKSPEVPVCSTADTADACSAEMKAWFGLAENQPLQFLLATVPDPLHTRLGLFTDSSIQAIQRAASDDGWDFATQWLPWNQPMGSDAKSSGAGGSEFLPLAREEQPGLLVFRHKGSAVAVDNRVLFVFLAGESPTAGINAAQFQTARAYARALGEPCRALIMAPTFSGSLQSLGDLLSNEVKTDACRGFTVRSGTATSTDAIAAFKAQTGRQVDFASLTPGTREQEDFIRDVRDRLGIAADKAAVLVEDESGYGRAVADEGGRVFRFPRDIAHLRNAWRDTVLNSKTDRKNTAAPSLEFSLKDADTGEDSIAVFSRTQTPPSQDAVLHQITSAIRAERIQLLQINATNVLDLLFLARLLRGECPNTRLLTANPDLLFIEGARDASLQGMLAVSAYPMIPEPGATIPTFAPDPNWQGVRDATASLLPGKAPSARTLWFLILGRDGYSPVRTWSRDSVAAEEPRKRGSAPPSATWTEVSALLSLLNLALGFRIFGLRLWPAWRVDSGFDEPLASPGQADEFRRHHACSVMCLCIVAQLMVSAPAFREGDFKAATMLTIALAAAGVVLLAGHLVHIMGRMKHAGLPWLFTVAVVVLTGAGFAVWCVLCFGDQKWFALRATDLQFGTSPVWPVFAVVAAFCLFALGNATRLFIAVHQEPEVLPAEIGPPLHARLTRAHDEFRNSLLSWAGLWTREQISVAFGLVALLVLVALAVGAWQGFRTVDGALFDWLVIPLQLGLLVALVVTLRHVFLLWDSLRAFLAVLKTLPLAKWFRPPTQTHGSRPIWVRHLNLQSLDIHLRKEEVLHDLALVSESATEKKWAEAYKYLIGQLVAVEDKTRAEILECHRKLRNKGTEIVSELLAGPILESWAHTPQSGPVPVPEKPGRAELGQLFVAFHYSSFLLYGVRQIQNLMFFLSAGSVLLIVSLSSYSIQAPQLVGRLLLALLAAIGVVIWKCLSGVERDPVLSQINGSDAGVLNRAFYVQLLAYGGLPAISLLASQYPSISNVLLSWVAPTLEAIK
jgi:hypothetical protein